MAGLVGSVDGGRENLGVGLVEAEGLGGEMEWCEGEGARVPEEVVLGAAGFDFGSAGADLAEVGALDGEAGFHEFAEHGGEGLPFADRFAIGFFGELVDDEGDMIEFGFDGGVAENDETLLEAGWIADFVAMDDAFEVVAQADGFFFSEFEAEESAIDTPSDLLFDEFLDEIGIELRSGAASEFGEGFFGIATFSVDAIGDHGIVGIDDGDDASGEGDIFAGG